MIRIFRVFVPVGTLTLLVSEILLISAAFVVSAYATLQIDPEVYLIYEGGFVSIAVVLLSILAALYFQDLYSDIVVESKAVLIHQVSLAIGVAFLTQGLFSYLFRDLRMPAHMMITGSILTAVGLFAWRVVFTKHAFPVVGRERLIFVGHSPVLMDIAAYLLEHPEKGLTLAGFVADVQEDTPELPAKVLGPVGALREIVAAASPSRIVVGMFERRNRVPVNELLDLRFSGHVIEEAATAYERVCGRVCTKDLRPSQLIYSGDQGPRRQTMLLQALVHTVLAAMCLVVALPLMLLVALAVRLSSPGPVLYRQVRVGMGNQPFTLYKFRSMCNDAEAGTGAVWAAKDDPRVTPVGKVIRKLRFDELPQFWNVIRGEMALVGPRPERPEFVQALSEKIPYYRQRHAVRPGITGWAQINYKYGDTFEDTITKLEYDLYYIKNVSLALDTYILFHTLKAMLLSRGSQ
jgi:sugar transferase (PEP-CTERM system associated)